MLCADELLPVVLPCKRCSAQCMARVEEVIPARSVCPATRRLILERLGVITGDVEGRCADLPNENDCNTSGGQACADGLFAGRERLPAIGRLGDGCTSDAACAATTAITERAQDRLLRALSARLIRHRGASHHCIDMHIACCSIWLAHSVAFGTSSPPSQLTLSSRLLPIEQSITLR